ncbi:integrase core domain-containing protein [Streptomyces sp. NPDC017966]|uniref:integrase core domain-containing protein n=1 Tax=Streptomyces sp. NPDC017966 TaxID=3365023 RepID=UPI00378D8258
MLHRPVELTQYTSRAFADACRRAGVRQSMSAIGSSADNALAESFNATFKRETLQGRKHRSSEREARLDAFHWLHRYNTRRRHSRLGHRSPIAYETASRTTSTTLAPAAQPVSRIRGQGPPHAYVHGPIQPVEDLAATDMAARGDTSDVLTDHVACSLRMLSEPSPPTDTPHVAGH